MRAHSAPRSGLAPCAGAQPAISTACAWCAIMPAMKATSAAVYVRDGGGGAAGCAGAVAQAAAAKADSTLRPLIREDRLVMPRRVSCGWTDRGRKGVAV